MMLLAACVIALTLLSGLILYALPRKNRVRAVFRGPLSAFSFEFEAGGLEQDSAKKENSNQSKDGVLPMEIQRNSGTNSETQGQSPLSKGDAS